MVNKIKQFIFRIWSKYDKAIIIFIIILFLSNFINLFGGCLYTTGVIRENDKRHENAYRTLKTELELEQQRNRESDKLLGELQQLGGKYTELHKKYTELTKRIEQNTSGLDSAGRTVQENNRNAIRELESVRNRITEENERIGDVEQNISELETYLP